MVEQVPSRHATFSSEDNKKLFCKPDWGDMDTPDKKFRIVGIVIAMPQSRLIIWNFWSFESLLAGVAYQTASEAWGHDNCLAVVLTCGKCVWPTCMKNTTTAATTTTTTMTTTKTATHNSCQSFSFTVSWSAIYCVGEAIVSRRWFITKYDAIWHT